MVSKRVAVVTGSSSGIGRAIATSLRNEKYKVLGIQRRPPGLQADLREIKKIPVFWKNACEKLKEIPQLVVLAAGVGLEEVFVKTSPHALEDTILINLISPLLLAKEVLDTWVKAHTSGHLIFIGSQAALPGARHTGNVVYTASKGGIHAIIGPLANEYGPLIRVNAIAPGDVITTAENALLQSEAIKQGISFSKLKKTLEFSAPLKRRVYAEEIAETVLFLEKCVAITGAIINVSAGKSAH